MSTRAPALAVLLAAACALPAWAGDRETVGSAMVQPLRDLSLIKQKTPEPLQRAATDPYAAVSDCAVMREEITELDAVLGEDLYRVNDGKGTIVTDVVKSAVRLPFSSVVRRLTGAHKRDKAYEDAVIAGVARRAYLKGAMTACAAPAPLIAEAQAAPLVPQEVAVPAVSVAAAPAAR